jgi:hypothetical protein
MARGVIGPATDARLLRESATLASLAKLDVADRSLITLSKEPTHDLPA